MTSYHVRKPYTSPLVKNPTYPVWVTVGGQAVKCVEMTRKQIDGRGE